MRAFTLRPGAVLPNGEMVTRVEWLDEGYYRLAVHTDRGGRWEFGANEEVKWPRRPAGVTRNWILHADPLPAELAVGDLLPPPDWRDPRLDPDWPEYTAEERRELRDQITSRAQVVRSVARVGPETYSVYLHHAGVTTRYVFMADTRIKFPEAVRAMASVHTGKPKPGGKSTYNRIPEAAVPRSGTYRSLQTGREARFAINLAGRGRYPSVVRDYDPAGEGLMKPPRQQGPRTQGNPWPRAAEWHKWELVDGDPHPMDPRA